MLIQNFLDSYNCLTERAKKEIFQVRGKARKEKWKESREFYRKRHVKLKERGGRGNRLIQETLGKVLGLKTSRFACVATQESSQRCY